MVDRINEIFPLNFNETTLKLFRCLRDCLDAKSYQKYAKESLFDSTHESWKILVETFATEKKNDEGVAVKPPINAAEVEIEYKNMQNFVLFPARHQFSALDGTARMESIRKETQRVKKLSVSSQPKS